MNRLWAAFLCLVFVVPTAAEAVQQCAPRAQVLAQLGARYTEARIGMGLAGDRMLEILRSEDSRLKAKGVRRYAILRSLQRGLS